MNYEELYLRMRMHIAVMLETMQLVSRCENGDKKELATDICEMLTDILNVCAIPDKS